jgi:tetratricopeptide (TPR) repeat protein
VAGLLEKDVGDVDEAIAACVAILDENPEDAAALETLSRLYAQQGRTGDLKEMAAAMLPIFSSMQTHFEALAALALMNKAIATERVSAALADRLSRLIKGHQHDLAAKLWGLHCEVDP